MKRGSNKFLKILSNKFVILAFIFIIVSLATVLAGNVIVKEGSMTVENNFNISNVLFVNQTSGNVGIGTASPLSKLSVGGNGIANTGVYGNGINTGVYGNSTDGYGIYGNSVGEAGVYGYSTNGVGVSGTSTSSVGVFGSGSPAGFFSGNVQVNGILNASGVTSMYSELRPYSHLRFMGANPVLYTNGYIENLTIDAKNIFMETASLGNVQIGKTIQIVANTSAITCNAGLAGAIYYNGGTHKHYGCDGTNWNALY